jgi:hypothetical protein
VLAIERLFTHGEEEFPAAIDALDALVFTGRRGAMRRALDAVPGRVPQDDNAPAAQGCRGDSNVETAEEEEGR